MKWGKTVSVHVQKLIQLLIIPLYAALVFALKEVLAMLPNIEVVTFLLAFAAIIFPLYMAFSIPLVFSALELLIYSINTWVILYLIVWPLLVIIIWVCRYFIKKYWWIFIIITGIWGFTFGTLDAFINLLIFGQAKFYSYWIAGLPFDAVHGIGNIMFSSFLYKPIMNIWNSHLQYYLINNHEIKNHALVNQLLTPLST